MSAAPAGNEINTSPGSYVINNLLAGNYAVTVTDVNGCDSTITITISQPSLPLAFSQSNLINNLCFGQNNGGVSITASNGTAPYNVSWSGPVNGNPVGVEINPSGGTYNVTGLLAGSYTVTVTDANLCTSTQTFSISQPPTAIAISQSNVVNVLCFGGNNGAVTITATNGTAPYNISWIGPMNGDPAGLEILSSGNTYTVNGLIAGTYTVTATDNNGCNINTTVTINQPPALAINTNTTAVSCNGGSNGTAQITVIGGVAGYNISLLS